MPSLGDVPEPSIEPGSPALQADSLPSEPLDKPRNEKTDKDLLKGSNLSITVYSNPFMKSIIS